MVLRPSKLELPANDCTPIAVCAKDPGRALDSLELPPSPAGLNAGVVVSGSEIGTPGTVA
jgi:hypothetical protein